MASWAALNVISPSAARDSRAALERATDEAQDAEQTAMYEHALRCQQRHERATAKTVYLTLLHSTYRAPDRLVYLCYKNLASMDYEVQSFEDALPSFSKALSLDATDVVVWYHMATSAVETGKWWLARRTLEEGFKVDATYWPLVETLALVLHVLRDERAYERVAQYLRKQDPKCAVVRVIDSLRWSDVALETEMKLKMLTTSHADKWLLRRARERLRHVEEIVERGTKRRRELMGASEDRRRKKMKRGRTYTLLQASWTKLGELLLEAFDEICRDVEAHVLQTEVEIRVGFGDVQAQRNAAGGAKEKVDKDLKKADDSPLKEGVQPKELVEVGAGAIVEASLLTETSDNDTQDSGKYASEVMWDQPRRRKSRRHEKRLWQEQVAAVKRAREQDLAYRLRAFLPPETGDDNRKAMPESVSNEWIPPLNVEHVDGKFCISNTSKEVLTEMKPFATSTGKPTSCSDRSFCSSCFYSGRYAFRDRKRNFASGRNGHNDRSNRTFGLGISFSS